MSNGVFKLDGKDYGISVESLERSFEVADTDATGRTADWVMHRDVVGTFYNYSMKVAVKDYNYKAYNDFYWAISSPTKSHKLEVPFADGTLVFDAYITKGKDKLPIKRGNRNHWDDLTINFIAMEPYRRA